MNQTICSGTISDNISIMSAKADREVGGGGGDARLKGFLALVQKIRQLTSTHNNSLRTLWGPLEPTRTQ